MMNGHQSSLERALEEFPAYLAAFARDLLEAMISDPIVTLLTIGSVALGFVTNVKVAVANFFLGFTIIRTINTVANAIGHSGQALARALYSGPKLDHEVNS